jgi:hypothetical protein
MTTDIARMDNNAVAVLGGANEALDRLGAWVQAAQHAHQLVAPLIGTAFVPDAYQPKVDPRATPEEKTQAYQLAVANATAAVLQGVTLGLDPMTALQQIYIVHGRPGMYAKLMVALVQAHGHEVWTEDLSDTRAVVAGRRRGTQNIERITITMDMARRARWTTNAKYQETPQDMLWARAASRVCDRIASDVLKGITSVEQIQDELAPTNVGTRTVTPRRRATVAQPSAEPPLDDEPAPERPALTAASASQPDAEPPLDDNEPTASPEPAEAVKPKSLDPQLSNRIRGRFKDLGITDRPTRLGISSSIVARPPDRQLKTANELTPDEALKLIETLERALTNPEPVAYLEQLLGLPPGAISGDDGAAGGD